MIFFLTGLYNIVIFLLQNYLDLLHNIDNLLQIWYSLLQILLHLLQKSYSLLQVKIKDIAPIGKITIIMYY